MSKTTAASISITGRVGKINSVENKDIVFVSLAVNDYKIVDGEKTQLTEWYDVVFYGKQAITVKEYVKVGSKIVIFGNSEVWDDGNIIIKVNQFKFDTGSIIELIGFLESKELIDNYLKLTIKVLRKIKVSDNNYDFKDDFYDVRVYNEKTLNFINKHIPLNVKLIISGEFITLSDDKKTKYVLSKKINLI